MALRPRPGLTCKVVFIPPDADPDGAAALKGVRRGDVIVEAQQESIESTADLERAIDKVKKSGGKQVLLLVEDATASRSASRCSQGSR